MPGGSVAPRRRGMRLRSDVASVGAPGPSESAPARRRQLAQLAQPRLDKLGNRVAGRSMPAQQSPEQSGPTVRDAEIGELRFLGDGREGGNPLLDRARDGSGALPEFGPAR